MKIGILTYHCVPNYGAQLQAISTVGYFKRCGHEPIVLHWYPKDLEDMYTSGRIPSEQVSIHQNLTETVLPLSRLCRTEDELISEINRLEIDAIFSGSDALFKYLPDKCCEYIDKRHLKLIHVKRQLSESLDGNPFWGGFISKLKRAIPAVAYSVSSQNCPFYMMSKAEKQRMQAFLSNYTKITTRDEWTKKMVETITGATDIQITPDPVFSFNQNCYLEMPSISNLKEKYDLSDKYALISFSDKFINASYVKELESELLKCGLQPIVLPMPEGVFDFGIKKKIELPLSPLEWYVLIKYASAYIGERMHPIVVSIHNSTPFFCFDEYGICTKKILGLYKHYNRESSKIFSIVNKAELSDYVYSYKSKGKMPTPNDVVKKLIDFPQNRCLSFASAFQKTFETSINNKIETLLK